MKWFTAAPYITNHWNTVDGKTRFTHFGLREPGDPPRVLWWNADTLTSGSDDPRGWCSLTSALGHTDWEITPDPRGVIHVEWVPV
jgi:hypothetical protein